jgi:hypothetical protein
LGYSVSGAGDVNGDGVADLIVGARNDDNNGTQSGSARVFSGLHGSILYTFNGDSAGDGFGYSVSGAGDVNGDGNADLVVGARFDDNNGSDSGSARVFSGLNGSILYTFNGEFAGDHFGESVSGAGDVNGDGVADLIVGARSRDNNGSGSGAARVFSGLNGSILYTFYGDSAGDQLGWSVSGAGDVNGDGYADLIAGAPLDDNNFDDSSGSARVLSGLDGSILYTFHGEPENERFGESVSDAGDVNADGVGDFIVGNYSGSSQRPGSARVFSGVDGSILYTFFGDGSIDQFGYSVGGAGDVNGDGHADLIVGAYRDDNNGDRPGSARVFSGVDGSLLYTFIGDSDDDFFGWSVDGAGDVNGDGRADLIVGASKDDNNGDRSGSVRVFSGLDGSILYTFNGDNELHALGSSVSGAGDVNGDGVADLIASGHYVRVFSGLDGSILYTFNGGFSSGDVSEAGDVNGDGYADLVAGTPFDQGGSALVVFSGLDGSILYTLYGTGGYLGTSVSGAGDVNGDGYADLIGGAWADATNGPAAGAALVFSGLDGSLLYTFYGDSAGDRLGSSVSGLGDVDGDGKSDLLVGAPKDTNNGPDIGSARVFLSSDLMNDGDTDHVIDTADNCPLIPNFDQADTDLDSVGDACDNCISIDNPGQEPSSLNPDCGEVCETGGCGGPRCANH